MNAERLLELADHIEGLPTVGRVGSAACTETESAFYMAYTHHDCGTPACIAGWAHYLFAPAVPMDMVEDGAQDALGLNGAQRAELFMPANVVADYRAEEDDFAFVEARHAAAVLRYAAATGDIDWRVSPIEAARALQQSETEK